MSNVRTFIGGKIQDKEEALKCARAIVEDLESGKTVGFIAVAVATDQSTFVYSGSTADSFNRLQAIGMATRLQYAAVCGELDAE